MPVKFGQVVITPGADKPYKVVLHHDPTGTSEHPVGSVAEGEAFIRHRVSRAPDSYQTIEWNI